VFVRKLAVFLSGLCVILRFLVLAHRVVVLSLVMVMRGGVVVTGRVMVMFSRRMFCHLSVLPLRRKRPDRKRVRNSSHARFAPAGRIRSAARPTLGGKAFVTAARGSNLKPGFPFVLDPDTRPAKLYII
jgi:hypothetical protein